MIEEFFIVNSVGSILMRLLFNLKSHRFNSHTSDRNVRGRKNKSGINQIWVMLSNIHDSLSSCKKTPIMIQQYNYKQMFDGMDAQQACKGIFEYGVNDDHLNLIYNSKKRVVINVKTPYRPSNDYKLLKQTMQGDTWALGMCSSISTSWLFWERDSNWRAKFYISMQGFTPNSSPWTSRWPSWGGRCWV